MKKLFTVLCLVFLAAALSAQNKTELFRNVPADTTFALGIDTAKLYSLPLFQKYFANTFFVKAFEKNIRAKSPDRKFGQYMLVTSPDLTPDSINVLIQLPDAAEMKTALIQSKQAVPVKYGGNTFYRMDNGVEFAFLADNLMLFSTGTGMKTYFSAKKGLSPKLNQLLADTGSKTIFNGFMVLSAELKKANPVAAPVELISYMVETAGKADSDLLLSINVACVNADAARQTMMMAQQAGLKPGEFIHVIADAHIYDRHVPAVEEIIKNEPKPAPKFIIDHTVDDFYKFTRDSFSMEGYEYSDFKGTIPVAV